MAPVAPTVMREGFVTFNARTPGTCIIEGRIPQRVVIGDDTGIRVGASITGTLPVA